MGLIKSANSPATVAAFSMRDIEAHAAGIIARAKQQAEQLLVMAETEAAQLREAARAAGHAEGFSAGQVKGMEEGRKTGHSQALAESKAAMEKLVKSLTGMLGELESQRQQLKDRAAMDVIALAIAIGRKVAKKAGETDATIAPANVNAALSMVVHASDVRVALHPSQRKTLEKELPALRLAWPKLSHIELVDDPTVLPGGCRVSTRGGQIDADLNAQLDRIAAELLPGVTS